MWSSSFILGLFQLGSLILRIQSQGPVGPLHSRQASNGSRPLSASDILGKGIEALGGEAALKKLKTVSYHAHEYRSKSASESEIPGLADIAIATEGKQTISYDFSNPESVLQRTDWYCQVGDYWDFARTQLEPVDATVVTRSGPEGYACFTKGNTAVFSPPNATAGYADAAYADVLVRDSLRLSPALLQQFQSSPSSLTASEIDVNGVGLHPALTDSSTNLTIIFDPKTFLPSRVRALEDHQIFGPSTSDFVLYNYTDVDGIKFPRNFKLLYNLDLMLIEILVDAVTVNPIFEARFFEGLPLSDVNSTVFKNPPTAPQLSETYTPAEVFESAQNLLWAGPYTGKLPNVELAKPIPGLDNLYFLTFTDNPLYTTTIALFEDATMVTDAPAHQSKLVIQYIRETFNRTVTHLLMTHHHHDHNYGASDYAAIGAKFVVPERFTYYWQAIPNVQFETATEEQPFIHKDANLQVRGVWHAVNAHSADWMYFTFTEACPTAESPMGVVSADAFSPGHYPWDYGQVNVEQWLALARKDRVPRGNIALPIHGTPTNQSGLYDTVGYEYPDYKTTDFLPGGPWC